MKKIAVFLTVLMICGIAVQAVDTELKAKLEEMFSKGKYLVLKKDNLPSVGVNKLETLGLNNYVHLKVNPDGTWKEKKFLGQSKATSMLKKGDILKIRKNRFKTESFGIFTHTEQTIIIQDRDEDRDPALVHYNVFTFKFEGNRDFETIKKTIDKYFKVFDTLEEAQKGEQIQINLGMTIQEVIDTVGEPKIKANLGGIVKFRYNDMTVIFKEEKVVDVEF